MPHFYGARPTPRGKFKSYRIPSAVLSEPAQDVDLTKEFREVMGGHVDQGNLGSCVFCSGTYLAAYLAAVRGNQKTAKHFSILYPYYKVRKSYLASGEIKSIYDDCGASAGDFIDATELSGLCFDETWPYIEDKFAVEPPAAADVEAEKHQTLKAYEIPYSSVTVIRKALTYERLPIQVGIAVPPELESDEVAKTGILDKIEDSTLKQILGYHEVLVVAAYMKDGHLWFTIWNSWGDEWGDHGNFHIPATLFAKLCVEAHVITDIELAS